MEDVFRKKFKTLTEQDIDMMNAVKDKAQELYDLFDHITFSREREIARMNLEQSVMWAVKAIT